MRDATRDALVGLLSDHDAVVEIGVGTRESVARTLAAAGVEVTVTDVHERTVGTDLRFVRDDVTDPDRQVYAGADVLYGLNLPPELHRPAATLARDVGAACVFTTLGGDPPAIPVRRRTIPGDTVFVAVPETESQLA